MVEARPAAFLDRDGVVNVDRGYVGRTDDFTLVEGAAQAIALLNRKKYLVFVVTNQSGIGRGVYTEDDFAAVVSHMHSLLAQEGAHIDDLRYCPFHPEAALTRYRTEHPWRKPGPGMILDLLEHWKVDRRNSFSIGDSPRDVEAAKAAGIPGYLFEGGSLFEFLRTVKPELDSD
jgi:D-glycero-D-manno-heptose 1,7-bisphosphate phosphatase